MRTNGNQTYSSTLKKQEIVLKRLLNCEFICYQTDCYAQCEHNSNGNQTKPVIGNVVNTRKASVLRRHYGIVKYRCGCS